MRGAKPATLRDYRSMLAEPGTPYRRGRGVTIGRIMAALGKRAVAEVTTAQVEALLVAHAREGVGARSVNKHRQVLSRDLQLRPAPRAGRALAPVRRIRPPPPRSGAKSRPRRLEVFTVEQIEALARTAETGAWRGPHEDPTAAGELVRAEEDAQLAELLRVAAYTGLRRGELVACAGATSAGPSACSSSSAHSPATSRAPRRAAGSATSRSATRRSARSTDSRAARTSPAPTTTSSRTSPATASTSALRRRYIAARDAAGLPPLRFHDLRHTAGTLLTRVLDPVTVRDVLGHADLKTTERYLHAVRASRLTDAATRAFTPETPHDRSAAARAALRAAAEQLGPDEARRILEGVG